jgi:DNA-binding NarL/FixJ family response regulator
MGSNGVTRVVIADDHPVVGTGLATLIAAHGWEICATATDGEEAVARATELRPDIVVMNYEMLRLGGTNIPASRLSKVRTDVFCFQTTYAAR